MLFIREIDEPIYSVYTFPYPNILKNYDTRQLKGETYLSNIFMTFDIETTSIVDHDHYDAYMYIWQACINHIVCMGRTWEDFQLFLKTIKGYTKNLIVPVYVHNLSFEFQFFRNFLHVTDVFATEPRKILRCNVEQTFEFRCSYRLTNMSLDRFLKSRKTVPEKYLKGENFNYNKKRTYRTQLTKAETQYCYNDVRGLYYAIQELLSDYNDDLTTIPMTSTGYVRREAKETIVSHPVTHKRIKNMTMTADQYVIAKEAMRGGNAHCNPVFSDTIVFNCISKDMSSAYPAVMLQKKFPATKFQISSIIDLHDLNPAYAYLMDIELHDVHLKNYHYSTIPYIAKAKAIASANTMIDNGRVVSADYIRLALTDIDWSIIDQTYDYSEAIVVTIYEAEYGYLPDTYRKYIFDRYIQKCELKFGDKYFYAKEKNKINSLFGMMLTEIVHPQYVYTPDAEKIFTKEVPDIVTELSNVRRRQSTFLAFQWGLWVTAHCRNRLQKAINLCHEYNLEPIYCDTDSLKVIGEKNDVEKLFGKLNDEILAETAICGFDTRYSTHGTIFNLGLWEDDGVYTGFKSLGAKKYYCQSSDGDSITVAGLSKHLGLEYFKSHGGIEAFNIGTKIPPKNSGRLTSHFIDRTEPSTIDVNGTEQIVGSGICLEPTTYTLGISDDYANFLDYLSKPLG